MVVAKHAGKLTSSSPSSSIRWTGLFILHVETHTLRALMIMTQLGEVRPPTHSYSQMIPLPCSPALSLFGPALHQLTCILVETLSALQDPRSPHIIHFLVSLVGSARKALTDMTLVYDATIREKEHKTICVCVDYTCHLKRGAAGWFRFVRHCPGTR